MQSAFGNGHIAWHSRLSQNQLRSTPVHGSKPAMRQADFEVAPEAPEIPERIRRADLYRPKTNKFCPVGRSETVS